MMGGPMGGPMGPMMGGGPMGPMGCYGMFSPDPDYVGGGPPGGRNMPPSIPANGFGAYDPSFANPAGPINHGKSTLYAINMLLLCSGLKTYYLIS